MQANKLFTDYDGRVISYAYSARNELASVSEASGTETYAYDPNGNQSYGYAYNADHQITGYTEGTSASVHTAPNANNISYGYDALGHLTSDTRTGSLSYAKTCSVDGVGNRLSMNENGAVATLNQDADDELNSASGTGAYGYTYSANGDQITSTIFVTKQAAYGLED